LAAGVDVFTDPRVARVCGWVFDPYDLSNPFILQAPTRLDHAVVEDLR
jgi:hypothetical protein